MATENQRNLVEGNKSYAADFHKGDLPVQPGKKYLIVTCMDSRIDNFTAFGISLGDAHIIRNAGGNAEDALRSILISQHFLGTTEIILIKHTGCGMLTFTNDQAVEKIETARGPGVLNQSFNFQAYRDTEMAVRRDVQWLRGHGALVEGTVVSGWIFDVTTGGVSLVEV